MKLTHLLNRQVVVARMATVSGYKQAFSTVTTEMFHIQPMVNFKSNLEGGVYGKTYRFYTDGDIDVNDGDRLRDTLSGDTYTVRADGVSRRTFGSFDYLIIITEKTK